MVIRPNKPILFGIEHDSIIVDENLKLFEALLLGKKKLYIELLPENLTKNARGLPSEVHAYLRLVTIAQKAGLEIIPLDRKDWNDKLNRDYLAFHIFPEFQIKAADIDYQMLYKREKMWAEKLRSANSNSIVVMHPDHAWELKKLLKIPDENCKFTQVQPEYYYGRVRSNAEALHIEKARLERRKRSANERQKRKQSRKL